MGDRSAIEWTDSTWNPLRARNLATGGIGHFCEHVSEACRHCYAETRQPRFRNPIRFARQDRALVAPFLDERVLSQPLRWRRPRMIFVCSMTDLFGEWVTDDELDKIFAVMALCPQHTFQCLTKRSERMRSYGSNAAVTHRVAKAMDAVLVDQAHNRDPAERWARIPGWEPYEVSTHGNARRDGERLKQQINPLYNRASVTLWRENESTTFYVHILVLRAHRGEPPDGYETRHRNGNERDNRLANLEWSSRSVNQQDKVRHGSNGGPAKLTREQASEIKVQRLRGRTQQSIADEYGVSRSLISMIESGDVWPGAIAWPLPNIWLGVSAEDQANADARIPDLLATPAAVRFVSYEPALGPIDFTNHEPRGTAHGWSSIWKDNALGRPWLDLIISGGESGHHARQTPRALFRSVRDQCTRAGIAYFHKQNGEWIDADEWVARLLAQGFLISGDPAIKPPLNFEQAVCLADNCGFRYECQSDGSTLVRVGKAVAGRLLDGVAHDALPGRTPEKDSADG